MSRRSQRFAKLDADLHVQDFWTIIAQAVLTTEHEL